MKWDFKGSNFGHYSVKMRFRVVPCSGTWSLLDEAQLLKLPYTATGNVQALVVVSDILVKAAIAVNLLIISIIGKL